MSRAITEPAQPLDGMSPGDTVIGLRPATPEWYDNVARQQAGLPPVAAREVAPQSAAQPDSLPMTGVARQVLGRELTRMREQAANLERSMGAPPIGVNGVQVPYMVEQRAQQRAELAALTDEIARMDSMTDDQVRRFAYEHGAR